MFANLQAFVLALSSTGLVAAASSGTASVTPHDKYSSSIGVLGCKIDTNRVAYFPGTKPIDCDTFCVKVTGPKGSEYLLHVDTSGGAWDISYDAWNKLTTGQSAKTNPTMGGGVQMSWETVHPSNCLPLLKTSDKTLAFSANNGMNFVGSCLSRPGSNWVKEHYSLFNIGSLVCRTGWDERCRLEGADPQAKCAHMLGDPHPLTSQPVYNIEYGTGKEVLAL